MASAVYLPRLRAPQSPLLPLVSLPQLDMGPWLLASLIVVLIVPRWGVLLHAALLALAILMDQTRLQPEFISLMLLMVGSLDAAWAKLLARSHLIALWFYAGLHKSLSPGYFTDVVPYMLGGVTEKLSPRGMNILGALAAMGEMSLALLAIMPRTRRACAVMAAVFHTSILLWLSLRLHWNSAVWPWNAALGSRRAGVHLALEIVVASRLARLPAAGESGSRFCAHFAAGLLFRAHRHRRWPIACTPATHRRPR